MKSSPNAIVIGAGIGGMATAIRLAVQGMHVTVYEKNSYPGGKLGVLKLGNYRFDTGPSLFTEPENIADLFTLAGEPMDDFFVYEKMPVSCYYFYEDGTRITADADQAVFAAALAEKMGESPESLSAYLNNAARLYKTVGSIFLDQSLHKRKTWFGGNVFKAMRAMKWKLLFQKMDQYNRYHFRNPKTVQLFNRYATYNGSSPYQAPALLCMIPHLEHNGGTYYPRGGMSSIAEAVYQLAVKKGVRFVFDSPVDRIIRHDNRVKGVVVKGENIPADIIVSNMDVYFTYRKLLGDAAKAKKILKQERSSSALIFYWGINKTFPELGLHNIFFTDDYRQEFDHLFRLKKNYHDPTVYINITSKCEPGYQAENGKENWFVMVNVPANGGQDWDLYTKKYRQAILDKLSRLLNTDIELLIEEESVLDPRMIESETASYMGSLYGTSSNSKMAAFLRHPNFSKKIRGLYFTGGSVHPGGGIPLCLRSAKITAGLIAADQKKKHSHS